MADTPKTVPDSPPADQTADIAQSEAYETANVVSHTAPETGPSFGAKKSPDDLGTLGPYRVLRELGRGGMGAVYLGFDERLKRKVALKVMLPKYAAIASSKNRFLREARAAAGITHDHIVTIYEADEHGGTPFMAMQLLQGYPLDAYLKKHPRLSVGELLRIGREMALGLAAAHSVGLVHRDIKPGNIWLEAPNGRVKILDFGLAKPTDEQKLDGELTATGVIVGTPAYMPPEQARGAKADFRADLFSLGVVLYRLATGTMPFEGDTMMAVLAAVIADDPAPVRDRNPDIPEPLAKLIHELMEKKPQHRPKSADEVAERLQQIQLGTAAAISLPMQVIPLDALPTATHVPSGIDPFAELDTEPNDVVTRHNTTRSLPAMPAAAKKPIPKWPLVLLGLFVVVLAALIPQIVSIMTPKGTLVIESSDADVEITVKRGGAVLHDKSKGREFTLKVGDDYTIEMTEKDGLKLNLNKFEITRNGRTTVKVIVQKPAPKPKVEPPAPAIPSAAPVVPLAWQGPSPLDALDAATIPDDATAAWKTLGFDGKNVVGVLGEHRQRHWGPIGAVAFGPDGKTLATVGQNNVVRIWDTGTRLERATLSGPNYEPLRRRFSRDGSRLLTSDARSVFLWDVVNAKELRRWENLNERIKALAFSEDNNVAVLGMDDSTIRLMDTRTGEQKGLLRSPKELILNVKISSDGRSVLSSDQVGMVRLWDVASSKEAATLPFGINELAFSPDGKTAYGATTTHIHVWDVAKRVEIARHGPVRNETASCLFSADGKYVVFGAAGVALFSDPATGKIIHTIDGHENWVRSIKFSPDGQFVLTGDERGNVRITNIDTGKTVQQFSTGLNGKFGLALSADNKQLAIFDGGCAASLWDVASGKESQPLMGPTSAIVSVAFAPDLKSVMTHDTQERLHVWNPTTGQSAKPTELTPLGVYSTRKALPFPDGKRAVVLEKSTTIRDLTTGEVVQDLNTVLALAADLSPDGKLLALGMQDESLQLWNVAATPAVRVGSVSTDGHANGTVRFSPDGRRLATEGLNSAAIWDVSAGAPKKLYDLAVTGTPYAIAWAPDGRSIALVQGANLSFWSLDAKAARKLPHDVQTDGEYFINQVLAYHPTGKWVAVVGQKSGKVFLYNPADGTLAKSWTFPAPPTDLAFAADGRHLAIANQNGTVYLLRLEGAAAAPTPLVPLAWNGPSPFDALDGKTLAEIMRSEKLPTDLVGLFGSADARHWGAGTCMAASPDGKLIATGGTDRKIRLWYADTLKSTGGSYLGHTHPPIALRFSPDGESLLSCGNSTEMKFRLWDVKTGKQQELEMTIDGRAHNGFPYFGPGGRPMAISFSPKDHATHAIAYDLVAKKVVMRWKMAADDSTVHSDVTYHGKRLAIYHWNSLRVFAFDGNQYVHLWEKTLAEGKECRVRFSPDGNHVAATISQKGDTGLVVWDTVTGAPVLTKDAVYKGHALSLAFSPDGTRIALGGRYNEYAVLEFPSGRPLATVTSPSASPAGYGEAVFNANGSRLVSFGSLFLNHGDGLLHSYDAKTGQPAVPPTTGPIGPITEFDLAADLKTLFTVGPDRTLRLWNTATREETKSHPLGLPWNDHPRIALLKDGKRAVVLEKNSVVLDLTTGKTLHDLGLLDAMSLAVAPSGDAFAIGQSDGTLTLWDVSANGVEKHWQIKAHESFITTITFSPDGKRLASGGNDHRAFVWDATAREPIKLCEAGTGGIAAGDGNVYRAAWTPDGQALALARGGHVQVWTIAGKTSTLKDSFAGAGDGLYISDKMSLHPSLPWVAVAYTKGGGHIALWDYSTKTKLKVWDFPALPTALAFAADGRHLLVGNPNGTVGVLRVDAPKPVDADRALAEWVLGLKGTVYILSGGNVSSLTAASDLPAVPFATLRIELPHGAAATNADAARIPDKRLLVAILSGTAVGDGMAAHLATIPTLTDVHLALTKVTDDGAIKLAGLPKLQLLTLANTAVTDKFATSLAKHPALADLNLHGTAVGDATAIALSQFPKLATLHLSGTKVTDKGLSALESCTSLRWLTLGKSPVTDAGVKKLAAALPLCKIEWDGGVIEPKAAANTAGLAFDGTSTCVKIPAAPGGDTLPLTIEAWITPQTVAGKSRHLFLFGEPGGGMGLSEKGNLGLGFFDGAAWHNDYGRNVLVPGKRVHVAAVATAKKFELFLDGQSNGNKTVKIERLVLPNPPALIGVHPKNSPEGYFHGTMHALRVSKSVRYDKPFTPAGAWTPDDKTILQYHFDEGAGTKLTDHSGNGRHGTIENGAWVK